MPTGRRGVYGIMADIIDRANDCHESWLGSSSESTEKYCKERAEE